MNNVNQNIESIKLDALKDYREKNNISVEVAADGMKVSKDFIHYIEAGSFEKLGAPTFIRGHLTNYSKVLGLDPQMILSQIPSQYLQSQQIKTSDAMGVSPLARVKRQSNHLGRYAVGTALLSMLCLSFYFIWDKWSVQKTRPAFDAISLSDDDGTENKKMTYSSLIPQVSGSGIAPQLGQDDPDLMADDKLTENAGTIDTPIESIDAGGDNSDADAKLQEETTEEDTLLQQNIISTGYTIKMQLAEQAWVSIKTVNGERIVHDLIGPGLREFHSEHPIHFRMGNVESMQLLINDAQVELGQFSDEDIADFSWPLNPSS